METNDSIPESIASVANSALRWINDDQGSNFELTGVVDYASALDTKPGETYELGLVLCDGEICARQQLSVAERDGQLTFSRVETGYGDIPPLLDPPAGLRASWLDEQLTKFEFILLLFYRGRW